LGQEWHIFYIAYGTGSLDKKMLIEGTDFRVTSSFAAFRISDT